MAKDLTFESFLTNRYLKESFDTGDRVMVKKDTDEGDLYGGLSGQIEGMLDGKYLVNFDNAPTDRDDFEANKYFDADDLEKIDDIGESRVNESELNIGDTVQIKDTDMVSRMYVGLTGQIIGKIGDEFQVAFDNIPVDADDDMETEDMFDPHCLMKIDDIGE